MARHRKLTQKFAGFPMFKLGTSGDTFPITSPFTSEFVGLDGLSLDLQFATDKTLTARKGPTPVFTRASTATFVGSNGLIQSAAINAARFDHDPITLACKGLLIEESRTNAALYSNQLVIGTGWTSDIIAGTTSTVDGVGPDGNNAYEIAEITNTGPHSIINTGGLLGVGATSITSGTTYTGSIFFKKIAGSVNWIQLTFAGAGFGTTGYANFNLSTGAIGNSSGGTARIEAYANGWYRVSWTAVATATTTTASNLIVLFTNNTNSSARAISYAGSTANKVLAAMCQFETGAFPTSYIPTTTASVIRSADVCSISGSDFSGFYNPLEGTTFVSGDKNSSFNTTGSYFSYQAGATEVGPLMSRTPTVLLGRIRNNAALDLTNLDFVQSPSGEKKLAVAWKATSDSNDRAYCSGGVILTKTNPNAGTAANNQTTLTIGSRPSASVFNGTISSLRYYKKRLPNVKLQAITV